MEADGFRALLETIGRAWNEGDTHTALACFTDDARYTEPPDTHRDRPEAPGDAGEARYGVGSPEIGVKRSRRTSGTRPSWR
jgi:ketosteroid isomerase-like protein